MLLTIIAFTWLSENITKTLEDGINGFLDYYGNSINNIFYTMIDISNNNSSVNSAMNFTMTFSVVLVAVLIGKQITGTYIYQTSGDPDESPLNVLMRASQALAVALGTSFIFNQMLELSMAFYSDLVGSVSMSVNSTFSALMSLIGSAFDPVHTTFVITIILLMIGYVVLTIIAGIRGGEIILMKIAMPLFACDLITTNRERWNAFFTGFVSAFLYNSVQVFCFMQSISNLTQVGLGSGESAIRTAVWLILAIKSPKMFEKFAYASGLSRTASSGMRMAAQMMIMRR